MMNGSVLYDGHCLTSKEATGIGTYARTLSEAARNLGFATHVLVAGNTRIDDKDPQLSEISFFDARAAANPPLSIRCERLLAKLIGKPLGIRSSEFPKVGAVADSYLSKLSEFEKIHVAPGAFDLAVSHFKRFGSRARLRLARPPSLFHLTFPTPLRVDGCPNIYTIHDIVPLRLPHATLDDKKHFLKMTRHLCAKADHIITVSEFSRQDIIRFFGVSADRVTNTYQCVNIDDEFIRIPDEEVATIVRRAFNVGLREYYLFFGAIEPKKNIARLIDAYAASGSRHPLLIVGGLGWQFEQDVERMMDERFVYYRRERERTIPERRVRRIPYLPVSQLLTLIKGARGVLFPSLYEGFGLPVLEAMQLGTPVVTSNVASLPEITGDAALHVDPMDVDGIARAIRTFDEDADLRSELARRGLNQAAKFSPAAYEGRIAAVYKTLGVEVGRNRVAASEPHAEGARGLTPQPAV